MNANPDANVLAVVDCMVNTVKQQYGPDTTRKSAARSPFLVSSRILMTADADVMGTAVEQNR